MRRRGATTLVCRVRVIWSAVTKHKTDIKKKVGGDKIKKETTKSSNNKSINQPAEQPINLWFLMVFNGILKLVSRGKENI